MEGCGKLRRGNGKIMEKLRKSDWKFVGNNENAMERCGKIEEKLRGSSGKAVGKRREKNGKVMKSIWKLWKSCGNGLLY